jgi:pimeloyl-ACP methyl ester carboxylesterase
LGEVEQSMDVSIRKLRIDGLTFHVRVAGAGSLMVLLHGFPDSGEVWRLQLPALVAAGHRVLVPDLRGCGQTDAPPEVARYRLTRLVEDVFDIVDSSTPDRPCFDLVGHDWGAAVGWLACVTRPERVRRFPALSVGHPEAYRWASDTSRWHGGSHRAGSGSRSTRE